MAVSVGIVAADRRANSCWLKLRPSDRGLSHETPGYARCIAVGVETLWTAPARSILVVRTRSVPRY
jgi:hypothetical protein